MSNALSGINILPTVLFAVSIIYWLTVIIGVVDLDFLDLDIDLDGGEDLGPIQSVLAFLNIREVPFMLVLSIFSLGYWVLSMILVNYLENKGGVFNTLLMIPIIVVCLVVTKFITNPLKRVFKKINQNSLEEVGIGEMQIVKVVTEIREGRLGQATIKRDGADLLINVKADDANEVFEKYEEAYIHRKDDNKNIYYIIKIKE